MSIGGAINEWYNVNKRDLPWRNNNDPYSIWVSEIIMQQTRINQGLDYYYNFIKQFPSVFHLANASENEVLMVWQGLGYYSRARNMHITAKEIVSNFNGQFPNNAKDLLKLKGVGNYTAAAISSICFKENIPAIDGNVIRVIARLFNIQSVINKPSTLKQIREISIELIKNTDASIYNQAMMDLGATICVPKNPSCNICPLSTFCLAKTNKTWSIIPLKVKKPDSKIRFFAFIVFKTTTHTLIGKRTKKDIWNGLHEFPLVEFEEKTSIDDILKLSIIQKHRKKKENIGIKIFDVAPHKLTHQTLNAVFVILSLRQLPKLNGFQSIEIDKLNLIPFPRLIEKQLDNIFFNDKL